MEWRSDLPLGMEVEVTVQRGSVRWMRTSTDSWSMTVVSFPVDDGFGLVFAVRSSTRGPSTQSSHLGGVMTAKTTKDGMFIAN